MYYITLYWALSPPSLHRTQQGIGLPTATTINGIQLPHPTPVTEEQHARLLRGQEMGLVQIRRYHTSGQQ